MVSNDYFSESLQAQEEGIELQKQILSDLQNLNDQHSIDVRNYVEGSLVSPYNFIIRVLNDKDDRVTDRSS
jgi:hypothetical protein